MTSPIDRLNELPPVPRRKPAPRRRGRYVLLLVTTLLIANALVGERGLLVLFRANREHARQQQVISELRTENDRLQRYIHALSDEPRFIEDLARRQLGMIKPGEHLFIVRATDPEATTPREADPQPDPR